MNAFKTLAAALTTIALTACTVSKADAPPALTGPSGAATSVSLTASPDSISHDGGSQSRIVITVLGPNGKPFDRPPSLRLDMFVNGVQQDYGTLSARTVVPNSAGEAIAVYTAPPTPPGSVFPTCRGLAGTCIDIVASPIGSSFETVVPQSVQLRLVPPGVILPPAGTPTAAFSISPTPVQMNVPVTLDASGSNPGTGATQITSYTWTFGDGTAQGTGQSLTHTFTSVQTFGVTLTVVNDRGLSASTTVQVFVGAVTAPTPAFVFSPAGPSVGQMVVFNAAQSTAAAGHSVDAFNWDFGDGTTASGVTVSKAFAAAGTFNVVLTVIDDTGQRGTTSQSVSVSAPGGGTVSPAAASFTFSPSSPGVGENVFFNASTSTAGTGHTIASYAWTFGDGTTGTGVTVTKAYATAGTYSVQLRITDEAGTTTTSGATTIVAGSSAGPTANFTISPVAANRQERLIFDASSSTTPQGTTIVDVAWNFGDDTPIVHCPGSSAAVCPGPTNRISTHTFASAGSFVVNLVVTDSAGRIGSRFTTVNIGLGNPNVVITFSPSAPLPGDAVAFESGGTTYSGNAGPQTYAWSFPGGAPASSANASQSVTFAAAGTYTVRLTITDTLGRTGTATANVPVTLPARPTAAFTFSPATPQAAVTTVNFNGSGSSASVVSWQWDYGDGQSTGTLGVPTTSHIYAVAGSYNVTLTVRDSFGQTGTATATVVVIP